MELSRPPPEDTLAATFGPSLKVGAACGGVGFLFGGTAGILKSTTPFLFATASGIQSFALGTTFWNCRTGVLRAWDTGSITSSDRTKASALAGGLSGGIVGLITRGRSNVLPAAVMWALFGGLGQIAVNKFEARPADPQREGFWRRMAGKSWSPVTIMSNEEYADILRQRLQKVDVEIAILDDKIAALQKQHHEIEQTKPEATPTAPSKTAIDKGG